MKLYYFCSSCRKENHFTIKAKDRFELQKERGDEINERCNYCGTITKRKINRVHAKANKLIIVVGTIAGMVITLLLAFVIPKIVLFFAASSVFSLPYLAWRSEEKKASRFNSVLINDK